MTKEAFIEEVIAQAHVAWRDKDNGWKVDLTICLGRRDRLTGEEYEPTVNALRRGRLGAAHVTPTSS